MAAMTPGKNWSSQKKQAQHHWEQALRFHHLQQPDAAVASYGEVIRLDPDFAEAYANRGVLFMQSGENEKALADYNRAIALNPDFAEAYANRGILYLNTGEDERALADYDRAIALKPDFLNAHISRGDVLLLMKDFKAAVESFEKVLQLDPSSSKAYNGIGQAFMGNEQPDIALEYYEKALELAPGMAVTYYNYGNALYKLNLLDAAIKWWDKAIALDPDYSMTYFNKSVALLLDGRFEEGLPLYEFRFEINKPQPGEMRFPGKQWLGEESIQGKTLLLYHEQGLGDAIQFCRYAKLVSALGAKVIMHTQPVLAELFRNLEGVDEFIVAPVLPLDRLPAFDVCCPLMSLPLALKTTLETIPGETPYLYADPEKVAFWEKRLGEKTKPRVGLVWSGNPTYQNDHNRSILLTQLLPYLPDCCEYVSLQKEVSDIDRIIFAAMTEWKHYEEELEDFSDTAALCSLMDVVISVDTAVAHLSGALGRPTWIMLPFHPDWRWLLERGDTPWYPSAHLYRQNEPGNWNAVFDEIRLDLLALGQ